MLRNWSLARACACALVLPGGLALVASSSAQAATPTCDQVTPSSGTPISSFSQLQTALKSAGAAGTTYYLTASIADSSAHAGGLVIPAETGNQSVDIDLNGCALTITHPGDGTAAITVPGPGAVPALVISDAAGGGGTLTVVGGAATTTSEGGGAGIAVGEPTGAATVPGLEVKGGKVTATGGGANTGTTNYSGAGAGIGGNGGAAGHAGSSAAGIQVDAAGTVIATGGASTGSGANNGGGGAGVGGGGFGANRGGGSILGSSYLDNGSITATGGGANSSNATAGAGAGFGGGGGAGAGDSLQSEGGSLTVTGGVTTGTVPFNTPTADGFGYGGGATPSGATKSTISLTAGQTVLSGEFRGLISEANGATLAAGAGAALTLHGGTGYPLDDESLSSLTLPATSSLAVEGNENLTLTGTNSLSGSVSVSAQSELTDAGSLTLAGTNSGVSGLRIASGSTLTIPAGASTAFANDGNININNGTIKLAGTLSGSGQLDNSYGAIVLSGSGSIPGNGVSDTGLQITGHIYDVEYAASGGTAPASQWVYADTFADAGESLPDVPARSGEVPTGWFDANSTQVTNTSKLASSPEGDNDSVALTAGYANGSATMAAHPAEPDGQQESSSGAGVAVTDWATVTVPSQGVTPTGTIQFYVCGPSTGAADCASTANPVGDPRTVSTGGPSVFAQSVQYTPSTPGTYCFLAKYSGDANYAAQSDGNASQQCFTVVGASTGTAGGGSTGSGAGATPGSTPTSGAGPSSAAGSTPPLTGSSAHAQSSPKLSVTAVRASSRGATVTAGCRGGDTTSCRARFDLTVVEKAHAATSTKPATRTVTVGTATVKIAANGQRTFTVTLNAAGRRLLKAQRTLRVRLSTIQVGARTRVVGGNRTLVLRAPSTAKASRK